MRNATTLENTRSRRKPSADTQVAKLEVGTSQQQGAEVSGNSSGEQPRRRGRPRKTEQAAAPAQTPKRRGRPRKNQEFESAAPTKTERERVSTVAWTEEVEETGGDTGGDGRRAKVPRKAVTVNLPEPLVVEAQLHASRKYGTVTNIICEAMLEYFRNHEIPPEVHFASEMGKRPRKQAK